MDLNLLQQSKTQPLAGLMNLSVHEPPQWTGEDLAAVLRHQLAAPLEYDLRTLTPGGEKTISQMTATITVGPRPKTFGDLIVHPLPPVDLLNLMKDFARGGRDDGSIPAEVGTVLYYAAISLGILRHNTRITRLDDQSLRRGIEWSAALPWIDGGLKNLFIEVLGKLAR